MAAEAKAQAVLEIIKKVISMMKKRISHNHSKCLNQIIKSSCRMKRINNKNLTKQGVVELWGTLG